MMPSVPVRTGHQTTHVIAGGVLHHSAPAGKSGSHAVYRREAEQIVAHRAVGEPPRPAGIHGDRAANRSPIGKRNVNRQPLPLLRQQLVQLG